MAFSAATLNLARVLTGAVIISFSSILVRLADVGPTTAAFYRTAIGGSVLLILALTRGQRLVVGGPAFIAALLAALFFALDLTLWHYSIGYVGPGLATILTNFQVFTTAAVGFIWLGEKPTLRLAVAIPLSLAGLFMLVGPQWAGPDGDYRLGVGLGLAAALTYTGYIICLRRTRQVEPKPGPAANMAVVSLAAMVMLGGELPLTGQGLAVPGLSSWLALIGLGVACQVIGWLWISEGLSGMEASRGGLVLLLQPTLAFVWDILFFGRPTGLVDGVGAAVALGAIYLGLTGSRK